MVRDQDRSRTWTSTDPDHISRPGEPEPGAQENQTRSFQVFVPPLHPGLDCSGPDQVQHPVRSRDQRSSRSVVLRLPLPWKLYKWPHEISVSPGHLTTLPWLPHKPIADNSSPTWTKLLVIYFLIKCNILLRALTPLQNKTIQCTFILKLKWKKKDFLPFVILLQRIQCYWSGGDRSALLSHLRLRPLGGGGANMVPSRWP